MDTSILISPVAAVGIHAAACIMAFASALFLSASLRLNKGAKANFSWALVALGLVLIGVSEGSKALRHLGYTLFEDWDGIMMATGTMFMFFGVALWYRLVKKANG